MILIGVEGFLIFEMEKIEDVDNEGKGVMKDLRNIERIVKFEKVR